MKKMLELLPALLRGLGITVQLTVLAAVLGFALAFISGLGSLSKSSIIRFVTGVYVEIFRGTSLLVQLFWMFYALPLFGIRLPGMVVGVLALGMNFGAYGSEVVRSSIIAVPRGQIEAAIALNMSPGQRLWRIILPQAWLTMIPPLGNLLIELLKGTALVSLITLADLAFQGFSLRETTGRTTEIYSLLLMIYFVLAFFITAGMRWLERRAAMGRS
ncbi:MAG: ectoine/hydroxyectoine ABC transporter permease subunit EhuC [Firmicutes bacterium]|nr:ectoine/hydroxyectoine ABC transporter permease subunit EhuC [Bacillota bacterium]